jgi:hypothetical protein
MGLAGYAFERFCLITYAVPLFYVAITNPGYWQHLTYWTLSLHTIYFTVDKASPYASSAIYLLHGMSFCGAMAVFMGYAFISLGGIYRFGSWIVWENAIGREAGTVLHDRPFSEAAPKKIYEHLWPVFAAVIDSWLSRDVLKRAYAGCAPVRTMLVGLGLYLAYASLWEAYSKATKGQKGSPLEVYQQPEAFSTSAVFGQLGLSSEGLPEDLLFVNTQKVLLIGFAALMYRRCLLPLFLPAPKSKKR